MATRATACKGIEPWNQQQYAESVRDRVQQLWLLLTPAELDALGHGVVRQRIIDVARRLARDDHSAWIQERAESRQPLVKATRHQRAIIDSWVTVITRAIALGEGDAASRLTRDLVRRCRELGIWKPKEHTNA